VSRPLVGPRLARVLAMVPWILAHPGVTITELAERFEVSEEEIERELELLPFCGLPPYTADRLMDVTVGDGGGVSIRLAEYFERPLRLTPAEGLALLAAGRTLLAVPGSDDNGPLAAALEKLERAAGAPGQLAVDVGDGGVHLRELQDAVARRRQVELEYYSFARDEITTRVVDPWRVFHAFGAWYLAGWCHRVADERLFRVDRVRQAAILAEEISTEPPAPGSDGDVVDLVYTPRPDDPRVALELQREAAWVVEAYPYEEATEHADGSWSVVLAVSETAWLERLLLTLGPDVRVTAPEGLVMVGAAAAGRIRERYGK
jgi:proteasome accessory factor C